MVNPLRVAPDIQGSKVFIDGDVVRIESLKIANPDLASHLATFDGPQQIIELVEIIGLAMQIKKMAVVTADVQKLEMVASAVQETMEKAGDEAFKDLEKMLIDQTDETKPQALVNILKTKLVSQLSSALDPSKEDSPFHEISEQLLQILRAMEEVEEEEEAPVARGRNFNLEMDGLLQELATQSGDEADYVNDIASETGSKEGDEVISIDPSITGGHNAKVVWEFKTEQRVTKKAALDELARAIENRGAQAGVFVLARNSHNENWAPFTFHSGSRAIIVVDRDEIDPLLVHYAHIWSRVEAVRSFGDNGDDIDTKKLAYLISQAKSKMSEFTELAKSHTAAEKGIQNARVWAQSLEDGLKGYFSEINEVLKPESE
jgi:hypothetical protein